MVTLWGNYEGISQPKASPVTPEQIEIRELKKKIQRIEMENEILKKAAVDSIGQRNSYVKT